ncbi:hypothetical protein [Pseudomonas paeninsulae]|uniref:hypothetical protein n=1 Tax=Pseudomonas paeninsulae TaxID=3110772 RepID=UPI002D796085|nr:hypothetical protein [Pseudomonas sp. IT1137]
MTTYQLTGEGYVIRDGSDHVPIADTPDYPNDSPDYRAYLDWLASGNTPTAVEIATQLERAEAALTQAVQAYMDTIARSHGYDGILSLCSYATSSVAQFAAEGQAGVVWRDGCWSVGHQIADDVRAGLRPTPTLAQVFDELPSMVWPA